MEIIAATKNDIPQIQELARKSWENAYSEILSQEQIEYMLSTMYSEEEISLHMENIDYHYFIIFNEKIPVGFIGFEHHYEDSTTKLHRIYLTPESKGKGLGKSAINFVKEQTQKSGDKRIILNVNKNNQAQAIYVKQGFRVYNEGIFDIGKGYVMDDYLMEFVF